MNFPNTKTEIAKIAVQMVVQMKVTEITEDQLTQHTNIDVEGITPKVGCQVVGYLVSRKLRPYTDAAVDMTIERVQEWQKSRSEKTNQQ